MYQIQLKLTKRDQTGHSPTAGTVLQDSISRNDQKEVFLPLSSDTSLPWRLC